MQGSENSDRFGTWRVYRSKISYFSGKLEAFLKYKNIPFELVEVEGQEQFRTIYKNTGVMKMPAMAAQDGSWLFDTTPMMQWLDQQYPALSVYPDDPALRFLGLLIEDYGDEWLWRPAMWWRWVPMHSRRTLGWIIGSDIISKPLARLAGWYFAKRQMREWLWDDGVDNSNETLVRDMLFRELEFLEAIFEQQDFLLGSHPSIADYGIFASMFRHFGNDPDAAEVMRMQAPNTYEWLARLWNAKQEKLGAEPQWLWPEGEYWQPFLARIADDYLPYLQQNAAAYLAGQKRFDYRGASIHFKATKTTRYRVWCLQSLQQAYQTLDDGSRDRLDALFATTAGLAPLAQATVDSGLAEALRQPVSRNDERKPTSVPLGLLRGQPRD